MEEILDVLNDSYEVIGQETRQQVHEQELLHASFQCWFYIKLSGEHYLMFQKRSAKVNYPNLLDITAAGHLQAGEGPREGAREIEEELGIAPPFEALHSIGGRRDDVLRPDGKVDREYCYLYAYHYQQPIEALKPSLEDVDSMVCIRPQDFEAIMANPVGMHPTQVFSYNGEAMVKVTKALRLKDFVPHTIDYYRFVLKALAAIIG